MSTPDEAQTVASARRDHDSYDTPPEVVDKILPWIDLGDRPTFREPCRGRGHIYDPISREAGVSDWYEIQDGRDYLDDQPHARVDLIVTNPPFSLALEFLSRSLAEATTTVYLLRTGFLASQGRANFWKRYPPTHLFFLAERPSFCWVCSNKRCGFTFDPGHEAPCPACGSKVKRGTDRYDYAWFAWDFAKRIKTRAPLNWI